MAPSAAPPCAAPPLRGKLQLARIPSFPVRGGGVHSDLPAAATSAVRLLTSAVSAIVTTTHAAFDNRRDLQHVAMIGEARRDSPERAGPAIRFGSPLRPWAGSHALAMRLADDDAAARRPNGVTPNGVTPNG
eukprot:2389073-Prymnesium_polylepis.1